jgi:hypothetical protein
MPISLHSNRATPWTQRTRSVVSNPLILQGPAITAAQKPGTQWHRGLGPAVPASPVSSLGDPRHMYLTSRRERPSGVVRCSFQQDPNIRPRSYARKRRKFVLRGSFWRLVHNTTVELFVGLGWVLGIPGRSPITG